MGRYYYILFHFDIFLIGFTIVFNILSLFRSFLRNNYLIQLTRKLLNKKSQLIIVIHFIFIWFILEKFLNLKFKTY